MNKIAFIGLGAMGAPIAHHILKKGFPLTVWNRTPSKADSLVRAGAQLAATPREAAANADVIFSCLFDDQSCLETAKGEHGFLASTRKGVAHINITTITPRAAQELTDLHERLGASYVSGPVLGRPEAAALGQLRSFLGGNPETIERVRPIVETYSGASVLVVGDTPVQATVFKLAANMFLSSTVALFGHVYALNERWNINSDVTHQLMKIFVSHPGLLAYEDRIRNRNFHRPPGEGFSVDGGLKDVTAMIDAGKQVGIELPFCEVAKVQCEAAKERGMSDMDWSALADMLRFDRKN